MIIDFTQALIQYDGTVIRDGTGVNEKDAILRTVVTNSLMVEESGVDGETKLKRHILARNIHENDTYDLSSEQITEIKRLAAIVYPTIIAGPLWEMIDPKEEEDQPQE